MINLELKAKLAIYILLCNFLFTPSALAQVSLGELESFENGLDTLDGEERYRAMMYLAQSYAQVDPERSREFLSEAKVLATKLGRSDFEARTLNGMGILEYIEGDLPAALDYYRASLNINSASNDSSGLAVNYSNLSNIHMELGDYQQAVDFFYRGLNLARAMGDSVTMGDIYNNLANFYNSLGDYDKFVAYLRKSLQIFKALDKEDVLTTYNNLGIAYEKTGRPDSALYFYKSCIEASQKYQQKPALFMAIANLTGMYRKRNELDSARHFLNIALKDSALKSFKRGLLRIGINEVSLLIKEGERQEALEKALYYMEIAQKDRRAKEQLSLALILQEEYYQQADYKKAIDYLRLYSNLKDSLHSESNYEELAKMEERYNFQIEKERLESDYKIELAQEASARKWAYGVGAALLALVLALLRNIQIRRKRNQILRKKNAQIEAQKLEIELQGSELSEQKQRLELLNAFKDRIMAVMAHDLKSPLNTLQGLLDFGQTDNYDDPSLIKEFLGKISSELVILRQSVENLLHWARLQIGQSAAATDKSKVAIGETLLEVEALFGKLIKEKNINLINELQQGQSKPNLDPEVLRIVMRNLISNALKFSPVGAEVTVRGQPEEGYYYLEVEDQGPGINPEKSKHLFKDIVSPEVGSAKEKGTGLGLHLSGEFLRSAGGLIGVDEKLQSGALFWVKLPMS